MEEQKNQGKMTGEIVKLNKRPTRIETPVGVKCSCGRDLIKALHASGGDDELHWVCESCRRGFWECKCEKPVDESTVAKHVALFGIANEIGFPPAGILAATDQAILPISGNEKLRISVALAIAGFAQIVMTRERDRATEERNAGAGPETDAAKIIDAERRRIVRAMSGLFSGEFREIVIKQCGLGT